MKRLLKRIFISLLAVFIIVLVCNVKVSAETSEISLVNDAPSAILMEISTKEVVFEKDSKTARAPASMTKIMTMILVMDAVRDGVLTMEQKLEASENAKSMGGTQVYLEIGEQMTVDDLLKAVAIASANDATVVFAEAIGGSLDNFIEMMNKKAEELGCVNTHFSNTNGLPHENHYSCSYDMGLMGCYLISEYENIILKYTNTYEDYLRKGTEKEFWLVNTNKLIKIYPEVDGLKTGWTSEAGYCLTATMKKNGIRFVSVIMGASEAAKRNSETMNLLNYGVSNYELVQIYKKGDIISSINDITIKPNVYDIVVARDINYLSKKGDKLRHSRSEVMDNKIKVYLDDKLLCTSDLTTNAEIEKASFIEVLIEVIKRMFLG